MTEQELENMKNEHRRISDELNATKKELSLLRDIFYKGDFSVIKDIAKQLRIVSGITNQSGGAAALFLGASGIGIYFGSGAPTISAAQGSLYLRSDGSSTSTRMYVNSNGSTTWVSCTTAS